MDESNSTEMAEESEQTRITNDWEQEMLIEREFEERVKIGARQFCPKSVPTRKIRNSIYIRIRMELKKEAHLRQLNGTDHHKAPSPTPSQSGMCLCFEGNV